MTESVGLERHPLADWVEWLVDQYELWERVPPCWWRHPAVVGELQVVHDVHEALTVAADLAQAMAGWHDQLGRVLDRLSHSPATACARHGEHRPSRTWDRARTSLERQKLRGLDARDPGMPLLSAPGSYVPREC